MAAMAKIVCSTSV